MTTDVGFGVSQRSCVGQRRSSREWFRDVLASARQVQVQGLSVPELRELSSLAGRVKTTMDSLLVRIAAEVAASGATASPEKVLQQSTKMSTRDARRMAKTADGLAGLPNVADRFASGEMTLDHAASLVDTARQTGTEAVEANTELLERAGAVPADLFARDARRFAAEHAQDRGEAELRRQRRRRRASLFIDSESGMGRLSGWFDLVSFGLIREAVDGHTERLWRTDSTGKDGADPQRTNDQRRADAVVEGLTGRNALTHQPLDDAKASGGKRGKARASTQLVVVADIGLLDGTDPAGRCEIPGTGPVPPSILAQLSPDTKLAGMIFDGDGTPLWLGRNRRLANLHQHLTITVRDSGCVQCGAPMHQCHIHHIRPWEHGGPTDIDNLQALCGTHHRQHHGSHNHPTRRPPGKRLGKPTEKPSKRPEARSRQPNANASPNTKRTRDGP